MISGNLRYIYAKSTDTLRVGCVRSNTGSHEYHSQIRCAVRHPAECRLLIGAMGSGDPDPRTHDARRTASDFRSEAVSSTPKLTAREKT